MASIAKLLAQDIDLDEPKVDRALFEAAQFIFPSDAGLWLVFRDRSVIIVEPQGLIIDEITDWTSFLEQVLRELGKAATLRYIETKYPHLAPARHDLS